MSKRIQTYSNENFDVISQLALDMADKARAKGRLEPRYGYSESDWNEAKSVVETNRLRYNVHGGNSIL